MKTRSILALLCAMGALTLTARLAGADPIGGPPPAVCGSCEGAKYTLSYGGSALPDADPLHETFRITLTVDTSTYTGGPLASTFLHDVGIKVSSSIFASSLFSAPTGVGNWTGPALDSGMNAGGCSGSGSGFVCTGHTGGGLSLVGGPTFNFVFDQTVNNGTLFTASNLASIKARYVDASGTKVGALLSEGITLQNGKPPGQVPEPATIVLIGVGLVGLGAACRRRMK